MAPLVPRMHVFEIDDFSWFPDFLRAYIQAGLTAAWTTYIPLLQTSSPAQVVARLLTTHLSPYNLRSYTIIDFCAGGGGPTPSIERHLNHSLSSSSTNGTHSTNGNGNDEPVKFILTDLHPHPDLWALAASQSKNISYVPYPVDAGAVPEGVIGRYRDGGGEGERREMRDGREGREGRKKVFRLFNLAFHHFDDGLARKVLSDAVGGRGGEGFGIFELQDRGVAGFLSCCLFGAAVFIMAPYYAWLWGAPLALFFTYVIPIVPVVLVFDGWMSCLRTRTPDEVEALLRTCGAAGGEREIAKWEIKSGSETFMWPVGNVNWIIAVKKE